MKYLIFASIALPLLITACAQKQREDAPIPQRSLTTGMVPRFDATQAFRFLTAQTDFGPRNPGSSGYQKCLVFLQSELKKYADTVSVQGFSYRTSRGEPHRGNNIIGRFHSHGGSRILLTAHWDTRPWADMDENPEDRSKPILGANDGASGVAVLLEIARQLNLLPPSVGVDIVFFDAEDTGETGSSESFALGSQWFAKNLPPNTRYRFAINLDMVGDKNLEIPREEYSDTYAPDLMDLISSTAKVLGYPQFADRRVPGIYDDHMPLNKANIPAVDLIDFNYPDETNRYWHTLQDTPDKCSPESLGAVGTVLLHVIYGQGTSF
ncbi:MAG: M28 family peptidase [Ignavibacteriales bacterium]|nr:M28 family peptidase [Ignavibacteriales bacterium]